jgi:putative flippase GtrA
MRNLLQQFLRREAHPLVQFIKYGMAGGLATAVDVSLTFLLSWKFLPALTSNDKLVLLTGIAITPVAEAARPVNYFINCGLAFLVANFVAYVANVLWVFEPGRHSRRKEITLFYVVSGISFLVGTGLAAGLIKFMGLQTSYAKLVNMFVSVMINYAGRKYFIFKG